MNEPWRAFAHTKYLNLETYRRDGRPVRTPVWFVESQGRLYVGTPNTSGKVKRIRRNPRVRVAPCTMRGTPTGEWVEARARLAEGEEAERADRLLARRYGLSRRLIQWSARLRGLGRVLLAIER